MFLVYLDLDPFGLGSSGSDRLGGTREDAVFTLRPWESWRVSWVLDMPLGSRCKTRIKSFACIKVI